MVGFRGRGSVPLYQAYLLAVSVTAASTFVLAACGSVDGGEAGPAKVNTPTVADTRPSVETVQPEVTSAPVDTAAAGHADGNPVFDGVCQTPSAGEVTEGLHFKKPAVATPKNGFCSYSDPATGLSVILPAFYMSPKLHQTDTEHLDSAGRISGFPPDSEAWARKQSDGVKFVSVYLAKKQVRADCSTEMPDRGDPQAFNTEACRWYAGYLLRELPDLG